MSTVILRAGGPLILMVAVLLVPAWAHAQATIAGVVRDTSQAVLPGVTVEAASPALIERVRTAVTDGSGQYRIIDLPPGTYTVTFTLPGFATVVREGISLTGAFTASVDGELRVGTLEETVTVTGETPIVDVQSARRQQVLDGETINAIPSTRAYNAIVQLVPGVTGGTNQVALRPSMLIFHSHGGRGNEGRLQVNGLNTGASLNGGGVSGYVPDIGNAAEVTFTTSGGLGEAEVGGAVMNIVPKTGGNTFAGSIYVNGTNNGLQSDNFGQELRDAGLSASSEILKQWDVNGSLGGPVFRDRMWFYANLRDEGQHDKILGMFANRNAYDPTKWLYDPDESQQGRDASSRQTISLRLTTQITPRNKLSVFWDEQPVCTNSTQSPDIDGCRRAGEDWIAGGSPTTSPEADGFTDSYQRVQQVNWTAPATNRLLFEAGFGTYLARWGTFERPGNPTRDLIRVQEQAGLIPGLTYRSENPFNDWIGAHTWRASASYVTGAHSMKFGYQGAFHVDDRTNFYNSHRLEYRLRNGVPNRLTMRAGTLDTKSRTQYAAFYAQEQWTRGRLTLQGAVRYDRSWSYFPEQRNGPDRFIPEIVFPRTEGVNSYNDITPRFGMAYDLFGDGRTALKLNVGKYLEAASNGNGNYSLNNPTSRLVTSTNRSWNDGDGDFVADCNLLNPDRNGECGPMSNRNFGKEVFSTTLDPAILSGWGVRPWDWQFGASVQHEILPRTSLEIGYHHRWFGNFFVTDNRAVGPQDFDPFSITAPLDPRLPDGGGYVIDDLYDIKPAKFGEVDNFRTKASNFGDMSQYWHGVEVTVNTRLVNGLTLQGGTTTGRGVRDRCDVTPKIDNPSRRNCNVTEPFMTQFKGLIAYTIPTIDVQVSSAIQLKPGVGNIGGQTLGTNGDWLEANWVVPNAIVAQSLGRDLASGGAVTTINLLDEAEKYGERINQIDFRVAKILRFGGRRAQLAVDFYNVLNSDVALTYNQTFGSRWLTPRSIMLARVARITAQFDF